tara:strand:+ start:18 stop:221 length:204 start_codon:yes stop_codon:yes gene_type:complete
MAYKIVHGPQSDRETLPNLKTDQVLSTLDQLQVQEAEKIEIYGPDDHLIEEYYLRRAIESVKVGSGE